MEYRIRRPDGDVRFVHSQGHIVRDAAGQARHIFGTIQDVTERRLAEEALRASENEFRATFELAAVGQAQADPATGELLRVNRKLCQLLGYSKHELLALELSRLSHPDDRERENALFRRLVRGEIPDFAVETRMMRKNGAELWVRITASLIRDGDGRPVRIVAICEDVTQRRRAEDELRASEARFRTFVDHATDAFFLHREDGTIIDVNRQACESLGYTRAELIGMTPAQIDADDNPESMAHVADRLAAGEQVAFERRHRRKDGTVFPADVRIRPFWLSGQRFAMSLARDVTERKRAEQALVESHHLLGAVVEGTSDAVYLKDLAGRYRLINSAGARFLGKRVDEVIGMDDGELFTAETAAGVMARDRQVMTSGESLTAEEVGTAAGVTRTYQSTKSALRDAQGNVTGLIGITRDVTELKRLEEQFRQAQKMEAVGRLAGGVAHDFNNLLTVINGNSDLVMEQLRGDERARELVSEIKRAGERAATLTRQLLAFSRKQVLQPQIVDLNARLGDLMKLLMRLIGEDIEVTLKSAPDLGLARVDPAQFEQAIVNLAVNARHAMPHGGRLGIATDNVEVGAEHAALRAEVKPGPYVRVSVTDSGVGMDEETRARIFEPFFTTRGLGEGTGLGLAMMYGFVKQSGGHVEVDSEPGVGTMFNLYLPRAEGATESARGVRESPRAVGGRETILLVEDDDSVRRLVNRVLRGRGYVVLEARSGDHAFAVAQSHTGPIHLVITDLVMPGMSGRDLAAGMAKVRPRARILFMSGYSDEAVMRLGIQQPGSAFLHKPFTVASLTEKVRELLDAG
jgi:PAS domain S-box-containing protein